MHAEIARRTAALGLATVPAPARVLDVGCGTGLVLRELAARLPATEVLVGIDPAPGMVEIARSSATAGDARIRFDTGTAEELPYADESFDLVISAVSFDHWADQRAGLLECRRVLAPGGSLVLSDLFSVWMLPTLAASHRGRARTRRRLDRLAMETGWGTLSWHHTYALIIASAVATG